MNPLSATYGAIGALRNRLYDSGYFSGSLQAPVVSIGSLSLGGAGKTPFLLMLGEMLLSRGVEFDVLSRGYGRKTRGTQLVHPEGAATNYGDEPVLLARKLRVPVIVGESRYLAGQWAEQTFGPRLHLLDDGFQHRALARDYDIVLLTGRDLSDTLFPMGRLREPLVSLRRAHVVVLMDEAALYLSHPQQSVWQVRRSIRIGNAPPRQVAFCGIARPQNFFHDLQQAGLEPLAQRAFRDHHAYTQNDVAELLRLRDESQAGGFVTTEKDAINLGPLRAALEPLHIVEVRMELEHPAAFLDAMLAAIATRPAS